MSSRLGTEFIVLSKGIASGPEKIIKQLRICPNLRILKLSHNALGGEGSKVFFQWLAYGDNDGVHEENNDKDTCLSLPLPQLTAIDLTGVILGDMGLSALTVWLERLKKRQLMNMRISPSKMPDGIRALSLQLNCIEGTSDLALAFISALTFHKIDPPYISSFLSYLNFSSNRFSPEFKQALFSSLPSLTSLRFLSLSNTGLNQADTAALAAYISQCRLTEFNASGNNMGYAGLKKVLKAMKQCWTLEKVDMYANDVENGVDNEYENNEGESRVDPGSDFIRTEIGSILPRNLYMKRLVQDQAFNLLRWSRLLLLNCLSDHSRSLSESDLLEELVGQESRPDPSRCCSHDCECLPIFHNSHRRTLSPVPIDPSPASISHFPFTRLPIEIQLAVLSQLAPILSSSQQIRIFEYAVDKTTLPDLSLHLPLSNGGGGMSKTGSSSTYGIGGLLAASYMKTEKLRWLELVECDAYDPNL